MNRPSITFSVGNVREVEALRVRVDAEACEGYGTCAEVLPEVFVLDDLGYASVAGKGEVPSDKVTAAQEAIALCPMGAISADALLAEPTEPPMTRRPNDSGND